MKLQAGGDAWLTGVLCSVDGVCDGVQWFCSRFVVVLWLSCGSTGANTPYWALGF